jgi:hypothetical protein
VVGEPETRARKPQPMHRVVAPYSTRFFLDGGQSMACHGEIAAVLVEH